MATRPYWSGQIRLSLVSLPVNIYAALNSARAVPLHEIYRKTGERVRHQYTADDKTIEREGIIKGYEYKKGKYVLLEPEEIKALKLPSKNILEIVQFVPANEIEPLFFERPYFVVPKDDSAEQAFITIREGLRKTGTYGIGQLVIAGRERLCALKPCGRGMMLETIRYRDEIRKADEYFDEIDNHTVGKEEIALVEQLIKQKAAHFTPDKFHDHYRDALRELIDAKLENRKPEFEEEAPPSKVVNLMDALRKSLAGSGAKKLVRKAAKKSAKVVPIPKPKKAKTKTAKRKKAS
jgi:DNA end-binding protein Ku